MKIKAFAAILISKSLWHESVDFWKDKIVRILIDIDIY